MADYLLLAIIIVWVTTGSPAGSAQKDCVAPRLLGQSTGFSYLAVGERFDGYCNFTNYMYENQTIKFKYVPGIPNYNTSVVYMLSTVLATFSIEHVDLTSKGLYSATACNSSCCTVCHISLSVEGACHNWQTPIPSVNYTKLNIPINETVSICCAFDGDSDRSHFDIIWGYGSKTEIVNRDTDNKYSKQHKWYSNCSFASFLTIMRVTEKDSGNYSCQSKSYFQPVQYGTKANTILDLIQRPIVTNSPDGIVGEDLSPTVLEYFVENFSWFIAFSIESPGDTEPDATIEPLFSSNWDKISVRFPAQALGHYRLCMAYKMNVTTDDHTIFNCSKTTEFKRGAKWKVEISAVIITIILFAILAPLVSIIHMFCKKKRKYESVPRRQDSSETCSGNSSDPCNDTLSRERKSNSAKKMKNLASAASPTVDGADILLTEKEEKVLDDEAREVLKKFPNLERAPLDRKVHFVYVRSALVEVRQKWNKVGSVLGLKDAAIQAIKQKNQDDVDGCLNDVIAAWFADSIEKDPATLRKLVGAIATRTGGENPAHAEKIAKGGLTEDNSVAENVDTSVLSAQEKAEVEAALANEGLQNEWKNIGIFLGLNSGRLKALNSMPEMIEMWLNKSYKVELFGEPSWQRLVTAVGSNAGARDKAAAEKIASLHRKPQVTKHPDSQENIVAGSDLAISVTATGTDPLGYQWQRDGVELEDANGFTGTNTSTLTVTRVSKTVHD